MLDKAESLGVTWPLLVDVSDADLQRMLFSEKHKTDECRFLFNVVKKETIMKINLMIFITSVQEIKENNRQELMMKIFESNIRPVKGDIIDDPGFHSGFHNGYEIG